MWTKIGYAVTAAWMLFVVVYTGSDPSHPLFSFIFVVPLAGWITVIAAIKIVAAIRARKRNRGRNSEHRQ
ncbi:MAG: hypothetical protein IPM60_06100 [Rhodospirillales bacterium]|nr:hypothetical protein [Rhodospirillales bacterium]